MKNNNPMVSVVVPTLNEEKYIEQTLKSVRNQNYEGGIEIIISDGNSKDNTVKICKKYTDKIIVSKTSIAEAKNFGAKTAKGEILIFLDADTILSENWIKTALNHFKNPETDMVVGTFRSQEKNKNAKLFSKFWGEYLPIFMRKIGKDIYFGPSTFAIRRNIFKKTGGFDEKILAGEDVIFVVRNRGRIKIVFDKNLKSFTSMRRFEKDGYIKWNLIWSVGGLPLFFGKRVPFDYIYSKNRKF